MGLPSFVRVAADPRTMSARRLLQRAVNVLGDDRGVLVYLVVVLGNAFWNWKRLVTLEPGERSVGEPSVAVLVPARNEESTIGRCVASLLGQDWARLRVVVLDDGSTDGTRKVLELLSGDARLEVMVGEPLPKGWLGKPWACRQLADAAGDADLLVFVDADTYHEPGMVGAVVGVMERMGLDMLSVVPRQELGGVWERWTVPLIPWALMTHLSPAAAQVLGLAPAAGAVGQVLAFRRDAYERMGGHGAVRGAAAEDVALARLATRVGARWRLAAGWRVSSCRMYRGRREAFAGLEKNLFPVLGSRTVPFLLAWAWLLRAWVVPPVMAVLGFRRGDGVRAAPSLAAAGVGAATWLVVGRALGLPRRTAAEGPMIVAVCGGLAVRSWLAWRRGRARWKGRELAQGRGSSMRSAKTTVRYG